MFGLLLLLLLLLGAQKQKPKQTATNREALPKSAAIKYTGRAKKSGSSPGGASRSFVLKSRTIILYYPFRCLKLQAHCHCETKPVTFLTLASHAHTLLTRARGWCQPSLASTHRIGLVTSVFAFYSTHACNYFFSQLGIRN